MKRLMYILLAIITVLTLTSITFVHQKSFGRTPQGERLERIKKSPNYKNGEFKNKHETQLFTGQKSRLGTMMEFLFKEKDGLRPDSIHAIKTDVKSLDSKENLLVWFGHSSYLLQMDGKRILVDPVFCQASPVSFVNKSFKGTDIYHPEDMPPADLLIISHDHWDHLDYETVTAMKGKIAHIVCPLGVGEHFEYWGFDTTRITELDWDEDFPMDSSWTIHCLPARHFSGRGLKSNRTLWASFLLEASEHTIYIGGDGGYDTHFAEIGKRFPSIDLAILENGQYSPDWANIHTLPEFLPQIAKDLHAKKYLTVHHSKYALSKHRWDQPLQNAAMLSKDSFSVLMPQIGEVTTW